MFVSTTVTQQEVQRDCQELGLRDWTALDSPEVSLAEAIIILRRLGPLQPVDLERFRCGLEAELRHGRLGRYNITNNHPLLTGMLVLNQLLENAEYYQMERIQALDARLALAIAAGDGERIGQLYAEMAEVFHLSRLSLKKMQGK